MKPTHIPVLVKEVTELLSPKVGEVYFDGTAGFGGHARAVQELMGEGRIILSDRDPEAIAALKHEFGSDAEIWHSSLTKAAERLMSENVHPDMILLDLGVSSPQLDQPERGFSFKDQGPLDMRMDTASDLTAADVANIYSEARLAEIIGRYGEEHRAKTVARAIVASRPFHNTKELADVVRKVASRDGKIDAATRTFQAIRIEVNQELVQLETALPNLTEALAPGGRIVVISFHSLEDRIVKQWFERESKDCICPPGTPICICGHNASIAKLTKKPVVGTEDSHNPRARSAKLRAAVKLNKNQKEAYES